MLTLEAAALRVVVTNDAPAKCNLSPLRGFNGFVVWVAIHDGYAFLFATGRADVFAGHVLLPFRFGSAGQGSGSGVLRRYFMA